MKTRAAVLTRIGAPAPYATSRPLEITEVELAPPGPGEVLVRVAAAGLCHSDLSIINGDRPRRTPIVLGHEAAGVVEALGEGVIDLEPGDHVILLFVPSCGHCLPCAEGRPVLCEPAAAANAAGTLLGGGKRLSYQGEPVDHFVGGSAFAGDAVLSRRGAQKSDKSWALEKKWPWWVWAAWACRRSWVQWQPVPRKWWPLICPTKNWPWRAAWVPQMSSMLEQKVRWKPCVP